MSQDVTRLAVNGTLTLSPQERIPYTPEHYFSDGAPREGAFVYYLRPLSRRDRQRIALVVQRRHGMIVADDEARRAIRDGAIAALEPEDAAEACGQLDEFEALTTATERDESMEDRFTVLTREVDQLERRISRLYQPLRDLQATYRAQLLTIRDATTRACIVDWEGPAVPCKRKEGFVTEEAMLAVPDDDLEALETRCFELKEVTPQLDRGSVAP